MPAELRLTHIGGPTLLIETPGLTLLTDPTFDPPGRRYSFGWGSVTRKLAGPALPPSALPPIDAILLTHDHHADNLDNAGRALLPTAATVVTTVSGARRLGGNAVGLKPWSSMSLPAGVTVTATPARHGPPLSHPIVGDTIGFALDIGGRTLWISGDTVLFNGVRQVAARFTVDIAVLHLGGVQFPVSGPIRYTMTARPAIKLAELLQPSLIIPVHYEGWSHFHEPRGAVEEAFAAAPTEIHSRVRWLTPGNPHPL